MLPDDSFKLNGYVLKLGTQKIQIINVTTYSNLTKTRIHKICTYLASS